jgi:hypothetical protein
MELLPESGLKTKNSLGERHRDHCKIQLQTYINKLNIGVGIFKNEGCMQKSSKNTYF